MLTKLSSSTRFIVFTVFSLFFTASHLSAANSLTRLSVTADHLENNADTFISAYGLSADGRYLTFTSRADNLVPNDLNNAFDTFLYDQWLQQLDCLSVNAEGVTGDSDSPMPAISSNGRYVAFSSFASDLVANDTNQVADIFLYDQQTHTLSLITNGLDGSPSNGNSFNPVLSEDGRWIAFESEASNLVTDDTNQSFDIFVYETPTSQIQRISVTSEGKQGNGHSLAPTISAEGRYIAFDSVANNLSLLDTNLFSDVFIHDRQTHQTQLVSLAANQNEAGNGDSLNPSLSADGQWIAFDSDASNLVTTETKNISNIFLQERLTQQTTLVSMNEQLEAGNQSSVLPTLSSDGRYVVFNSAATNLALVVAAKDENGAFDVFKYDRVADKLLRLNINAEGNVSDFGAFATAATINQDGCYTVFASNATDLVVEDTNNSFDIFLYRDSTAATTFELTTGVLTLPAVQVAGVGIYDARLTLVDDNFNFELETANILSSQVNTGCNYFSFDANLLHLSAVELLDSAGKLSRYEVVMRLIPNTTPLRFELLKATPLTL